MISEYACVQVHTPRGKCAIGDYSEQSLVLLIPGSRLKATNSPSARPYCNRQPLEKFRGSNETAKIYQRAKNFHANYF